MRNYGNSGKQPAVFLLYKFCHSHPQARRQHYGAYGHRSSQRSLRVTHIVLIGLNKWQPEDILRPINSLCLNPRKVSSEVPFSGASKRKILNAFELTKTL